MIGVDLMRPNPLPQPMLSADRSPGTTQMKDVQIITETGLHVTSIYAGGSGWAPHKIGEVSWDSAEFSVSLEGPDRPEQTYRYGADVAAGAAAAMFAVFYVGA
jgi:hypothetical protein